MQKKTKLAVFLRVTMVTAFILAAFPFSAEVSAAPVTSPQASLAAAPAPAGPTTNQVRLRLVSARDEKRWPGTGPNPPGIKKGDVITSPYKYIINLDNTGDPAQSRTSGCDPAQNAEYPDGCNWPSIKAMRASAPIVTQGDNNDLNANVGFNLPNGKYLISIVADGFKIDGVHFTLPRPDNGPLVAEMEPYPLPTTTIRIQVFEDNAVTNSGYDVPGERGLKDFEGHIADVLGIVTTDVYGNPLCTQYNTDNAGNIILDPVTYKPSGIKTPGGKCLSDATGQIVIPNLGPNRYTATVTPPADGKTWVQTTTLEGNHDYDIWVAEGGSGYDTEFTNPTAEATPPTIFGFIQPSNKLNDTSKTGKIKGRVWATKTYFPQLGGLPYNGQSYVGGAGTKLDKTIKQPWLSLNALQNGDQAVWVGRGDDNGNFQIDNVPNGDYSLAYWDNDQEYILEFRQVTVTNGQVTDMGNLFLAGWWATFKGKVCIDTNNNGKCDPGEAPLKNQPVTLKTRANSVMERGSTSVVTDSNGYYELNETYPLTSWIVMEIYNQRYYTTGVTFQADNQDTPTFIPGNGVDVSIFPIIGLGGTMDWAVRPYDPIKGENGGIVGTVTYDSTRNELDPRFAATEVYQPGIPGLTVNLYAPVPCPVSGPPAGQICDPSNNFLRYDPNLPASDPNYKQRGAYVKSPKLNTYQSEEWERPTDCIARGVDNKPLPVATLDLPLPRKAGKDCIEAPMMGAQFQAGFSTVDGNYGFTTVWRLDANGNPLKDSNGNYLEDPMPKGFYLVQVDVPTDPRTHKPVYQVTREEDVNVFTGDQYSPQEPPPACAGALHTVDVKDVGTDNLNAVDNPAFADGGGSPYEGQDRPLCDMKLIEVKNGRSIAPNFNFFTEVPLPGRWNGYIVDDLNLSTDPHTTLFGEKRGLPNSPIGIYDFNNRLILTVQSDPNGLFEVLMPSTSTYNCPLPAGPCPSVYRLVGNDPGQPGKLNPTYDPQYRTISASFEIWPGLIIPADLAPTRIGSIIQQGNGSQFNAPSACRLADNTPQILAVSQPFVYVNQNAANRRITIQGQGFGATRGSNGNVTLSAKTLPYSALSLVYNNRNLTIVSWSDTQIVVEVPSNTPAAPWQMEVTSNNGQTTANGITLHVIGSTGLLNYNPTVYQVGPNVPIGNNNPNNFRSIQPAIEKAASQNPLSPKLVVVYPGKAEQFNPHGVYYENLVIHSALKLQGVGPGGFRTDGSYVQGTVIDGLGFEQVNLTAWNQLVTNLQANPGTRWAGNQRVFEGAVITVFSRDLDFNALNPTTIDGLTIQGGDQLGQPNKINSAPNGGVVITQGGGIFVNGHAHYLQITNNIIQSNGGAYGGGIRLGTAYVGDNQNDHIRISQNRLVANGGTNLAGGIGIFSGAHNYEIDHNDICGNYSAEYGGGISHYGRSNSGKIHDNRIYFNNSFDEGGAIMIAGELPADPTKLSTGAGPVDIYNNLIQSNLSNDDGGGIRFLMSGNFEYNVYNNLIVNNVSTHEGGGIAIDDAPNVRIYNNTIMKNITTATAATSNGQPAPAGVSTTLNSQQLQATLPAGSPTFSRPLVFNNIFWDNRAGNFTPDGVSGIGLQGDPNSIRYWDVGMADKSFKVDPAYSIFQSLEGTSFTTAAQANAGGNNGPNNKFGQDPKVVQTYDTGVAILPWRTNPNFIGAQIVAVALPVNQMGNYHLQASSPAINGGVASRSGVTAPTFDIDNQTRIIILNRPDMGADER